MFTTKTGVHNARTLAAMLGVAVAASPALAAVSFFDGTFHNWAWTLTNITNAGGTGSFVQGLMMNSGGNGGDYRLIRNQLLIGAANSLVVGVHLKPTAQYDPSTQGAITSIDYSEDSINLQLGAVGGGQRTGLAIEQGGNIYLLRIPTLDMPNPAYINWTANVATGIVASQLHRIDANGNFFTTQNPDFSATGGVMTLGFYRGNSSGSAASGLFNSECGIDNWSVKIVPGPGVMALAGVGGLFVARRRRG